MFLMVGIQNGRKDFDFNQVFICDLCGSYGRYQVYMTFTVLTLFFIPCFRWNRRYYVQSTCCGITYELDPDIGRRIARGERVEILPQHLTRVGSGNYRTGYRAVRHCPNCGFTTQEDFAFCPKCGRRF